MKLRVDPGGIARRSIVLTILCATGLVLFERFFFPSFSAGNVDWFWWFIHGLAPFNIWCSNRDITIDFASERPVALTYKNQAADFLPDLEERNRVTEPLRYIEHRYEKYPPIYRVIDRLSGGRNVFFCTMKTKGIITVFLAIGLMLGTIGNIFADAKEEVNEATKTLKDFSSMPERQIPPAVLKKAKGFAVFHIVDVALLVNGKGGPGVVVARTNNGWSGPMFVGLGGAGVGAQIGAKVKELVLVLNTDKAVQSLSHGNVKVGADLTASAGPAGASAEAETAFTNIDMYSYAGGNGVFAGASLEGSVIAPRSDVNNQFYGKKVTPEQILTAQVQPPAAAAPLMTLLRSLGSTGMVGQANTRNQHTP